MKSFLGSERSEEEKKGRRRRFHCFTFFVFFLYRDISASHNHHQWDMRESGWDFLTRMYKLHTKHGHTHTQDADTMQCTKTHTNTRDIQVLIGC